MLGVIIELRGDISLFGPIDKQRSEQIRKTVASIRGVCGKCRVNCHCVGNSQIVTIMIPWVRDKPLDGVDKVLRGIGAMPAFFSSPASPLLKGGWKSDGAYGGQLIASCHRRSQSIDIKY